MYEIEIETSQCSTIREPIIIAERMIIMPSDTCNGIEFHGYNKEGNNNTIIGALYCCGIYNAMVEWLKSGLSINDIQDIVNGVRNVGIKYLNDKYQLFIKPSYIMTFQNKDIEVIVSNTQVNSCVNSISIRYSIWFQFIVKNFFLDFPSLNITVTAKAMYLMKVLGTLLSLWGGYPFRGKIQMKMKGKRKIPYKRIIQSLKSQMHSGYSIE